MRISTRRFILALFLATTVLAPARGASGPGGDSAALRIAEGDRLLLSGEYGRAIDTYRDLLGAGPDAQVAERLVAALLKRDQASEALTLAEKAVADAPTADALALRSLALFRAGRFRDAETDRDRAVALASVDGSNASGLAFLADARLRLSVREIDKVGVAVDKARGRTTFLDRVFQVEMLLAEAEFFEEAGLDASAVRSLEAALAASPRTNEVLVDNLAARVAFQRSLVGVDLMKVADGPNVAIMKVSMLQGIPLVHVSVNGAAPEPFLLDTGAGITVLFAEYVKRAKLKTRDERAWAGAVGGDGRTELRYGLAESVQLGGVTIGNVPVGVIDWKFSRIAGIIGLPVFKQFITTFDYPRKEVRLQRPRSPNAAMSSRVVGGTPFRSIGGAIFVEAMVNDRGPFNFEIDTGAGPSDVPVDDYLAAHLGLTPNSPSARNAKGSGASGEQRATVYENARVAWADQPPARVNLLSQRLTPARPERRKGESGLVAETEMHGLVGFALLRNSALTIDFAARRLWVERN